MSLRNLPSIVWKCRDESRGDIPYPRFGQAVVRQSRNTVLVHGGAFLPRKSRQIQVFSDLFLLKVGSVKLDGIIWRNIVQYGDLPAGRYGHHLCRHQHLLYLIGGQNDIDATSSMSDVYQLNTISFVWSRVDEGETKGPSWLGCSADVINCEVFVFGGRETVSVHSNLALFDMVHLEWSYPPTCGPLPPPRCDHASTVVGSSIFIHGGCGGQQTYYADLFKLDTTTLTWEEIIAKGLRMTPRAGMTLTAHHSKDLYVFGGYNDILCPDGGPVIDSLMKYSLSKNEWKKISSFSYDNGVPDNSYDHSAFIISNTLYIICGLQLQGEINSIRRAKLLNPSERNTYLMATQRSSFSCTPEDSVSLPSDKDFRHSGDSHIARYQSHLSAEQESFSREYSQQEQELAIEKDDESVKADRPYIQNSRNDVAMQSFLQLQTTESDDDKTRGQDAPAAQSHTHNDTDDGPQTSSMNLGMNSTMRSSVSNSDNASFSSPEVLP